MTSLTREVWGREFNLEVRFEDLDDEGIKDEQWESYGHIIIDWSAIDGSLSVLKDYCSSENHEKLGNGQIDNIFRYVIPRYLFVPQGTTRRTVALMCDYLFDPEHGLAIVFEDETITTIGKQEIVL